MSAYIQRIATQAPTWTYEQSYVRDRMKMLSPDTRTRRLIHAIYNRSGIETRHSVLGDFIEGEEPLIYREDGAGGILSPGTAERNAVYAREARELAVRTARQAIDECPGVHRSDVTHVIFASCTGFANPGPDFHIIQELGLRQDTQRYTLGFMGCYAAFPALRMASQFCAADPDAVVLVVCLELCTLHMHIDSKPDNILANSLFADGAAAAIVSARKPDGDSPCYELRGFASNLLTTGEAEMAWDIGNEGFNIVLSSYVPEIIGANVRELTREVLSRCGMDLSDVQAWAIHPGGRSILDKVEQSLQLPPEALEASRNVLTNYGNMSSATILFVLKELLENADDRKTTTLAMAFGPGLTVETALLGRIGSAASRLEETPAELAVI